MNAAQVKDALRRRHPAVDRRPGYKPIPAAWTTIEEWLNIDLLAVSAWSSVKGFPPYARIGYEIKVSRSDYKRELRKPGKRAAAVAFCHEFYIAVPAGLLSDDEIAWRPPPGLDDVDPFRPLRCYGYGGWSCDGGRLSYPHGFNHRDYSALHRLRGATCPVCYGTGTSAPPLAERARAPRLWIPADVGLVEIDPTGTARTVRKAPRHQPAMTEGTWRTRNPDAPPRLSDFELGQLIRWISVRPDPRHADLAPRRDTGTHPG